MFSVPQVSVRLAESTPEQIKLIKNFLSYWNENRETILHGKLDFKNPEMSYIEVSSADEGQGATVPSFCGAYIRENNRRVVVMRVAKGYNKRKMRWEKNNSLLIKSSEYNLS